MSELQEFVDDQEMEFYAAVSDIVNAMTRFGPEVLLVALQQCEGVNNLMIHEVSEEEDTDLTTMVIPDTLYLQ